MKRSHLAIRVFVIFAALAAAAQSGGQKSFELMKTLVGNWEGKRTRGCASGSAIGNGIGHGAGGTLKELRLCLYD